MSAPPSSSSVAISPVAAFSSGGPARKARARPRTMTTWSDRPGHVGAARRRRAVHARRSPACPAADSRARLQNSAPPWTNSRPGTCSRLAPADSTRWTNGSLFSQRDLLRAQQLLQAHAAACAPASMPASLGDDHAAHAGDEADAGDRCRRPAPSARHRRCPAASRRASTARGRARRDRAGGATRSRGSSWPRLSNSGAAFARSPRACAPRARASCSISAEHVRAVARRTRSRPSSVERRGGSAGISRRCSTSRRRGEVEAVERLARRAAGADLGPDRACALRRRAVDAQARAGDERRRRREQEDDRRRDLALGAEAPQRHRSCACSRSVARHLRRVVVHAARGDPARRDGVDAHAGAHSSAAVSVKLSMPARAAPEWPMPGMPPHMSAMMLTMAPPRVARPSHRASTGEHSRAIRKPPVRLLRTTASQPLALIAASGAGNWPPALLTSAVDAAVRAPARPATVACTAASSRMSQAWTRARAAVGLDLACHGVRACPACGRRSPRARRAPPARARCSGRCPSRRR